MTVSVLVPIVIISIIISMGISVLNRYANSRRNIGYGFGKSYWDKLDETDDEKTR